MNLFHLLMGMIADLIGHHTRINGLDINTTGNNYKEREMNVCMMEMHTAVE